MIRYSLVCAKEHSFESWFQSAAAYDGLRRAGHVNCPVCGDTAVDKSLMAPAVRSARKLSGEAAAKPDLSTPKSDIEVAFAEMRRQVEENSEYVGMNFATEARSMHDGDTPERPIYGEVRPEEAKRLIEDGVPVAPLPFMPKRKTN